MSQGNVPADQTATALVLRQPVVPQQEPNWLRHRGGAAAIDRLLIAGADIDTMSAQSGRQKKSVKDHIYHLRNEHGLTITESNGTYRFG